MTGGSSQQPMSHPEWQGRPFYGYDSPAVQEHYIGRSASPVAEFFMPHLLLECVSWIAVAAQAPSLSVSLKRLPLVKPLA